MSPGRGSQLVHSPMFCTTGQVSRLLVVTRRRVYSWVSRGLVSPQRDGRSRLQFSFQDLLLMKTAKSLLDLGIPLRRVRDCLVRLKEQLPQGHPLTGIQIFRKGSNLVAREGSDIWDPESGQLLLNFQVGDLAAGVTRLHQEETHEAQLSAEDLHLA